MKGTLIENGISSPTTKRKLVLSDFVMRTNSYKLQMFLKVLYARDIQHRYPKNLMDKDPGVSMFGRVFCVDEFSLHCTI